MKLLLIGHSIIDNIEENGKNIIKPGGIYYSVCGALSMQKNNDEIFLLTGWNQSSFGLFEKIYSKTNMQYANEISNMPEVFLYIHENDRDEIYKNLADYLSVDKIIDWNIFDGILINMITGFDLSLKQLKEIKTKYKGLIYFDIHTLSRGVNSKMERFYRQIPNIKDWLKHIDILQTNQHEIKTIFNEATELDIIHKIFKCNVRIVLITRGNKGVSAFFENNGKVVNITLPAEAVKVINTVGCGDIFGSVFFSLYLRNKNILESLKNANSAAGSFASEG